MTKQKSCRFLIKQSKWKLNDNDYKEWLSEVHRVYKAIMKQKNSILKNEQLQKDFKLLNIVLSDGKSKVYIPLFWNRKAIYRHIGLAMYFKFNFEIPTDISIKKIVKKVKIPKTVLSKNQRK